MTTLRATARPTAIGSELRGLLGALSFLTRVPVGRFALLDGADVTRGAVAFPLVGTGIGACVGGIAAGLAHALTPLLAVGLALTAGTLLTGALHLDALADSADALGAGSRERALAIMREHTIGAYGASALTLDLLLKAAALTALLAHGHVVRMAVVAGALSRATPVLLAAALPYARPSGGTGDSLTRVGRGRALVAAALAVAIAATLAGVNGLILAASVAASAALLGLGFRRALGGVTGDLLGASVELSELVVLVVAVALVGAR